MNSYDATTLEAIIANAIDEVVGAVSLNEQDIAKVMAALDLNEEQTKLAITTANAVFGAE